MVTESSPPVPFNGEPDYERLKLANKEIVTRSTHLCTIIKTIESTIDELPDSSVTPVRKKVFDWVKDLVGELWVKIG